MATLSELEGAALWKYDPELPADRLEVRCIYATEKFQTWVADELPSLKAEWTSEIEPSAQLVAFLDDFCAGEELGIPVSFHPVSPHENSVWELKTFDLRIFGWFYKMDCFIAYRIESAAKVKKYNLYNGMCVETAYYRDNTIDLDPPRFIPGVDPHVVISNYYTA